MPKLSLYHDQRTKDFKFFDRTISEMFTVGCATVFVHKYLGPKNQGVTNDATQPNYINQSAQNIQDLLYLENRDRKYETTIYRLRIHHSMQDIDFDLTQFGLFLNNDTLFGTVHKQDCVDTLGRLLMAGDVIELPYLREFYPLNYDQIQSSLKRYYVISDTNNAAEGFSPTWYPHLWRVKCEPMVDSQEFADILNQPQDKENYMGDWAPTQNYLQGDRVTFGGKIYVAKQTVPINVPPTGDPNDPNWAVDPDQTFKDMMSTYNKLIEINNAIVQQAEAEVPKSGFDTVPYYVVPYADNGINVQIDNIDINTDNANVLVSQQGVSPTVEDDGYVLGYLTNEGIPPNGLPVTPGVSFPTNPGVGDFCLRLDYLPNRLFRFDGAHWTKFEDAVRTNITPSANTQTQHYSFYDNNAVVQTSDRGAIPSKQSLSQALKPQDDN